MALYIGNKRSKLHLGSSLYKMNPHSLGNSAEPPIEDPTGLPSEFQQVKWIQAANNVGAYINLGFTFDSKAKILMNQYVYNTTSTYPFGATENSGKLRCCLSCPYSSSSTMYGSNGSSYISASGGVAYSSEGTENRFSITLESGTLSISNGATGKTGTATSQADYTMTNNLYLFAQNYNGSPRWGGIRQIGYFKYYDKNNQLICDLVPCYRKTDSVIGMYDLVRRVFLINIGSGQFLAGPVVDFNQDTEVVNLVDTAVDDDGILFGANGYRDDCRWSSSGNGPVSGSYRLTGWMPYQIGAVYKAQNFYLGTGYVEGGYVIYKKKNGSTVAEVIGYPTGKNNYIVNAETDTFEFTASMTDVEYFRISGYNGILSPIVTVSTPTE